MALKSNINDNEDLSAEIWKKAGDIDEIGVVDEDCCLCGAATSKENWNSKQDEQKKSKHKIRIPDRKSFGKRCRTFIQGGQQKGRNLLGRGRRISKEFGSSVIGTRPNTYRVRTQNNISQINKPPVVIYEATHYTDRARRSRLAEDALFYEDTIEQTHLHGHVREESPKKLISILHKRVKIKRPSKRPSSLSQSPVVENCICLKYLNGQQKISMDFNAPNNTNKMSSDEKENQSAENPKNKTSSADNKNSPETDSLEQESPRLRPSSVDIGFLMSLSLTDPVVTSFNNNGIPQWRSTNNTINNNLELQLSASMLNLHNNRAILIDTRDNNIHNDRCTTPQKPTTHTQIDFTNFLIPGQGSIINCPYYWGKIDRYEAEALLADKPEGSFLLRDSAQDDFVFSVSFRRYSRSLHARIEEEGHMFSFDSHDPGVHASHSIGGLLGHYKDPLSCMFFEPMLLFPVVRKTCFSLQSLARASICDSTTYSNVAQLPLPKVLKQFLRDYHYRHKIRTRYIETIQGE